MMQVYKVIPEQQVVDMLNDEQCWEAVLARDARADGMFVFAVHSTGVYCRPSCPARHPRRAHVVFFQLPREAEAAGFRACRRCHPEQVSLPDEQAALIEQVCSYVEAHLEMPLRLSDLSQQFHLSPYHLQRIFKRVKGVTPRQYIEACRLRQFKARLQEGEDVTDALYNAGYQSSSSVYTRTVTQLGMTPTAYRRGGKGICIGYTTIESVLGHVLIAATARGLVALRFGDDQVSLTRELLEEYPEAECHRDDEGLHKWVLLFEQYLQGTLPAAPVALDELAFHASAFQWKVWQALQRIPAGETCSYQAIARAIGQPSATRAVARACAGNPVAVFIPCHRVVRSNGELGGYHWGIERKQALLTIERISNTM